MYETVYHRPTSLESAVALMGESGGEGKYMSGGQTLIPTMKQRLAAPSALVDLRHVPELKGIEVKGRSIRIGGGTTHAEVARHEGIASACPGFSDLAGLIGDPAVRHLGTLGGSIANNDPAADYPAAMLALGATIHTNRREIPAGDFFLGLFETALEEDEIVTAASFEAPDRCGYEKFRNPASRYAMCGVFVAQRGTDVKVGVTGSGSNGAFRWEAAEQALSSNFDGSALADLSADEGMMMSDMHGTSAYRANLVKVVTKRAVAKAATHG
ncbi:MAG: xanthine dehydrogenase family protein subunit M [Aurantimonas endophytica]|uniref:FAD binding domain-containing protein n=1 Tax=Aurantimonas endophytica TaxID=1522175 RepID=UPI003001CCCB